VIKIRFAKDYSEITAAGHSGYAEEGHDVVCASVSSAFVLTSEMLKNLRVKHNFGMDGNVPFIGIKLAGRKTVGVVTLSSLIHTMELLKEEYPDFISVECVDTKKVEEENLLKILSEDKDNLVVTEEDNIPTA